MVAGPSSTTRQLATGASAASRRALKRPRASVGTGGGDGRAVTGGAVRGGDVAGGTVLVAASVVAVVGEAGMERTRAAVRRVEPVLDATVAPDAASWATARTAKTRTVHGARPPPTVLEDTRSQARRRRVRRGGWSVSTSSNRRGKGSTVSSAGAACDGGSRPYFTSRAR